MVEGSGKTVRADGRLRALDGLRFVAAIAVVLYHYTARTSPAWGADVTTVFPFLSQFTRYGDFGPYLFFMISGFVVLMSAWGRSVPAFIASRVSRLYPAYWFAVVATAVVLLFNRSLLPVWDSLHLSGVLLNLTMFQTAFGTGHVDPVYWTLWAELRFYLLLVVMMLIGITRRRLLVLCFAWPVVSALAALAKVQLLTGLLGPSYAPFFCIGILLYLVYREGWSSSTVLLMVLNSTVALRVCEVTFIPAQATVGPPLEIGWVAVLLALSIGAIVLTTMSPVARLDWRWLSTLGALTYPVYLLHEHLGWVAIHRLVAVVPAYPLLGGVVVGMCLAAWLVHRFVEKPLGSRLRRKVERDLTEVVERRRTQEDDVLRGARFVEVARLLPRPTPAADDGALPPAGALSLADAMALADTSAIPPVRTAEFRLPAPRVPASQRVAARPGGRPAPGRTAAGL